MPKILKAYTTLEILVVIGIMIFISGMTIPVAMRQTKLNELSLVGKDIHSSMFLQQQSAFSGKNETAHGIFIENTGYYLFEGDYSTTTVKDYYPFGKGVRNISGNIEIYFEQNSQVPNEAKTIVLNFDRHNYVISINSLGVIDSYVQ